MLHLVVEGSSLPCLVVGAGTGAAIKIQTLVAGGCNPVIVAPTISTETAELVAITGLTYRRESYSDTLLDEGYRLVVTATNNTEVNASVATDCRLRGILVLHAEDPSRGSVRFPATGHAGELSVAVYAAGLPLLSRRLRDYILTALPHDTESRMAVMQALRQEVYAARSAIDRTTQITATRHEIRRRLSEPVDEFVDAMP